MDKYNVKNKADSKKSQSILKALSVERIKESLNYEGKQIWEIPFVWEKYDENWNDEENDEDEYNLKNFIDREKDYL